MSLMNLSKLSHEIETKISTLKFTDIILPEMFKTAYSDYVSHNKSDGYESIEWSGHTSCITSSSGKKIFVPNYWFLMAANLVPLFSALVEYKSLFQNIFIPSEYEAAAKSLRTDDSDKAVYVHKIKEYFTQNNLDGSELDLFLSFLCEKKGKSIDRGDYYVSPLLKTANLLAETQSAVAEITSQLSQNQHLIDLLSNINDQLVSVAITVKTTPVLFQHSAFLECTIKAKLKFPKILSYRFISSLITKPFVILTGLSGSGKTKLAEAFSLWISGDPDSQIRMVSVGADWTNREPLLGYPNALEPGRYVKPDSGALDLILNAIDNPELPHFLVLDEMNMSHVERYFADFLSAMESSRRHISLHPDTPAWKDGYGNWNDGVPDKIELPKNLFIIGTVNIDETTYMFSPKVLDRAQVIEFRVSKDEMAEFIAAPAPVDMTELKGHGAQMGADFVVKAQQACNAPANLPDTILPFFDELQSAGAEFGYRTASEISRFVSICTGIADGVMNPEDVIDAAIMQKLLPKVHGSRNKIEKILRLLGQRCLADPAKEPFKKDESGPATYPVSYEKIERMHRRVIADGFTSYAEA